MVRKQSDHIKVIAIQSDLKHERRSRSDLPLSGLFVLDNVSNLGINDFQRCIQLLRPLQISVKHKLVSVIHEKLNS